MITSNPSYREKILMILKDAIKIASNGLKPSYKFKEIEHTKKPRSHKVIIHRKLERYLKIGKKKEKSIGTEAYSFVDGKDLAQFIGKNKKEVKAVETCYNYFPKFREDKITDQDVFGAILRKNLLVLTSKYKLQTIMAWIYIFAIGYISWFVWFFIPSTIEFDLSSTLVFYSFEIPWLSLLVIIYILIFILDVIWVRLVALAIYLKNYFIVLDSQGIYYKKIGKPKFLAWNDMSRITAKRKYFIYNFQKPNNMVISVYMQSKGRVRFNSSNYHLKQLNSEDLKDYIDKAFATRTKDITNSYWKLKLENDSTIGKEIFKSKEIQDHYKIESCPRCNVVGEENFKIVEDKSRILSYIGNIRMYAKKYICKRCGYEF